MRDYNTSDVGFGVNLSNIIPAVYYCDESEEEFSKVKKKGKDFRGEIITKYVIII